MSDFEIDIVIPWVDGSDPEWIKERALYSGETPQRQAWFRDWGLLPYVFRGIETFAPWVRKVHFVTWGHLPDWLNTECEKLNVVKHKDFIPEEYLPTFNSNTIELNFHRIPDLAENFLLFNDDTFIISPVKPSDFYKNGLPRRYGIHVPDRIHRGDFFYQSLNDIAVINDHFSMKRSVLTHLPKWFSPHYGLSCLNTLIMLPFPAFYGFYKAHLPVPYQIRTYEQVWNAEPTILDQECRNRFRTSTGVNNWLIEYWSIAEGKFYPQSKKYGTAFKANDLKPKRIDTAIDYITNHRGKVTCINDGDLEDNELDQAIIRIKEAFDKILPVKCNFEL